MRIRLSKRELIFLEGGIALVCLFILAAIIYLIFAKGRDIDHQSPCMSHMRQLSLGLMMAAQDDNDVLPDANAWVQKTGVKDDKIFRCIDSGLKGTKKAPDYMYVAALIHGRHGLLSRRPVSDIQDTSLAAELVELVNPSKAGQTPYVSDAIKMSDGEYGYDVQTALIDKIALRRHDDGSIIAFVDGHIEYIKAHKFEFTMLMNSMTSNEPLAKPFIIDTLFSNMHAVCAEPTGSNPATAERVCTTEAFDAIFAMGEFIIIGRPKTSMKGTKGAIMTTDGNTGEFTFTGGGKVFPKNSAFPSWWDFSDTANLPRWVGDGPAKTAFPYTYNNCTGLFGGSGKRQLTTTLVFKAKVPAHTTKRIFMLNTGNGEAPSAATSILGITQTDAVGVTEDYHMTATGTPYGKDYNIPTDGWASASGVMLPLKNGYTYKITYHFNLTNGMVFPCFEL